MNDEMFLFIGLHNSITGFIDNLIGGFNLKKRKGDQETQGEFGYILQKLCLCRIYDISGCHLI